MATKKSLALNAANVDLIDNLKTLANCIGETNKAIMACLDGFEFKCADWQRDYLMNFDTQLVEALKEVAKMVGYLYIENEKTDGLI